MSTYHVFACTDDGISRCASIVKVRSNDGVIVFPTDTIYGIGCDPYNDNAAARIFRIKRREEKKPLPVLAYSLQNAEEIVSLGEIGRNLAKKFWPGALTIVAPVTDQGISSKVTAGSASLAVRVPANRCVLSLLGHCKYLVGTSANLSGEKPLKSAQDVIESSLDGFDALLDGGVVEGGVESTIVDITKAKPRIMREGAINSGEVFRLLEQF